MNKHKMITLRIWFLCSFSEAHVFNFSANVLEESKDVFKIVTGNPIAKSTL